MKLKPQMRPYKLRNYIFIPNYMFLLDVMIQLIEVWNLLQNTPTFHYWNLNFLSKFLFKMIKRISVFRLGARVAQSEWKLGYGLNNWDLTLGRVNMGFFLFTTVSRPVLGPTQPPVQWIPGALSLGVKRPGREADHLHLVPRSRMRGAIPPLPNTPSCHGELEQRDNFTFTF